MVIIEFRGNTGNLEGEKWMKKVMKIGVGTFIFVAMPRAIPKVTPESVYSTPPTPAFETIFAIMVLLGVAYLIKRRR
jgi:hypothetical protein